MATFKTGSLAFAGIILLFTGAGIKLNTLGTVIKRCGVLTVAKFAIAFGFGFLYVKMFGANGIFGVTSVAFVTCMCAANPGVFMGLVSDYGEPADMGNFVMMNIVSMPCWPLLVLAAAAGLKFNWLEVVSVFVPFIVGLICGNIDPKFDKVVGPAVAAVMPVLGCCFGAALNLVTALQAGVAGIILSVMFLIINVVIMLFVDRVINRRPGYAAVAWCSVAGIAMAVPAMLSNMPEYAETLPTASAQIGLCLIITSIATPFLTKWVVDKWGSPKVPSKKERMALGQK